MKLNIRKKISLLIIVTLTFSMATLAFVTILSMKRKATADLEVFEKEETEKVKKSLESYVGLAYQSVEANYKNIEDKNHIEKIYGHRLQNTVDLALSILQKRAQQVENGEMPLAEAQQRAIQEIESMRYDDGTGYIWINDTILPIPTMIMHPTLPGLNGKVLDDPKFNCDMGKNQIFFRRWLK